MNVPENILNYYKFVSLFSYPSPVSSIKIDLVFTGVEINMWFDKDSNEASIYGGRSDSGDNGDNSDKKILVY